MLGRAPSPEAGGGYWQGRRSRGGTIREAAQEMAEGFDIRDLDSNLRDLLDLQKSLDARRR